MVRAPDDEVEGSTGTPATPGAPTRAEAPAELPGGLEYVRTTPVFDPESVPPGLRKAHQVADGVWARLVVHTGALTFVFEDRPDQPRQVSAGQILTIPPARPHHVDLPGSVTFSLEFYRVPSSRSVPGAESTGLVGSADAEQSPQGSH
ncbi:MAG: DUF1971 domain-containing protein [Actinomycetales bacterium]